MKLFAAAICLLCCGAAFGQTTGTTGTFTLEKQQPEVPNKISTAHLSAINGPIIDIQEPKAGDVQIIRLVCDRPKDADVKLYRCDVVIHLQPNTSYDISVSKSENQAPSSGSGTVEGPPEKNLAVYPPYATLDCAHTLGCGIKEPPPFDVPAKEWDKDEWVTSSLRPCNVGENSTLGPMGFFDTRIEKKHHVTCADKSRFLLAEESGKRHCLKLVP